MASRQIVIRAFNSFRHANGLAHLRAKTNLGKSNFKGLPGIIELHKQYQLIKMNEYGRFFQFGLRDKLRDDVDRCVDQRIKKHFEWLTPVFPAVPGHQSSFLKNLANLLNFHDTLSKLEKEGRLSAEELVFAEEARKKLDALEVLYRQENKQVARKVLSSDWEIPSEEGQLEQVFVAYKENTLVGSVSIDQKVQITGISENPAIAEISKLVVDVDHRREGIGKLLLERALMEARIWKVSFVTSMLSPYNIAGVNFFRKNDFKKEMSGSSTQMILELPHLPND